MRLITSLKIYPTLSSRPESSASLTSPSVVKPSGALSDAKPLTIRLKTSPVFLILSSDPMAPRPSSIPEKSSPALYTDENEDPESPEMTLNSISQPRSDKSEISLISLGVNIRVAPNPMKTILDFKRAESPLALLDESLEGSAEDNFSHASAMGSLNRFNPYLSFICSSSLIIR